MTREEKRERDWARVTKLAKGTIDRLERQDEQTQRINELYENEPVVGSVKVLGVHKL
jgi:hypothetical protein